MVTAATVVTASSEDAVLGSSTLRLCDTMYVAETIMITSSTSTTSTIGVTLISVIMPFLPPFRVPAMTVSSAGGAGQVAFGRLGLSALRRPLAQRVELLGLLVLRLQQRQHLL